MARKVAALVPALLAWFDQNARDLPWRRTRDAYAIWISEIMLQQTQVKTVIPYWERLMRELPDVKSLAKAQPERVLKLWEGLGYYTRARNLQKAARVIVEQHRSRFPTSFDEVLALPGIGRYTAGAICSIAFNQPTPILDGNVIRVLARVFGIDGDPREKTVNAKFWLLSEALVTSAAKAGSRANSTQHATRNTQHATRPCSALNQSLMELGALICAPRQPSCARCPVKTHCVAFRTGRTDQLPLRTQQPRPTQRQFAAFVIQHRGRYLVRQRPSGVLNPHLWEFPNIEFAGPPESWEALAKKGIGFALRDIRSLATIRHSITRYSITVNVLRADLAGHSGRNGSSGSWKRVADLHSLPFASAHKRILLAADSDASTAQSLRLLSGARRSILAASHVHQQRK